MGSWEGHTYTHTQTRAQNVGETVTRFLVGVAAQIVGNDISRLLFWVYVSGYSEIYG